VPLEEKPTTSPTSLAAVASLLTCPGNVPSRLTA
jgi:hypothetical protein